MWIQEFDGFKKPLTNYEHSQCEQELKMWQEKYFATAGTRTRHVSTNVFLLQAFFLYWICPPCSLQVGPFSVSWCDGGTVARPGHWQTSQSP